LQISLCVTAFLKPWFEEAAKRDVGVGAGQIPDMSSLRQAVQQQAGKNYPVD
jgi:hypothetical protein